MIDTTNLRYQYLRKIEKEDGWELRDRKIIHVWTLVPRIFLCLNRTFAEVICPLLALYFFFFKFPRAESIRFASCLQHCRGSITPNAYSFRLPNSTWSCHTILDTPGFILDLGVWLFQSRRSVTFTNHLRVAPVSSTDYLSFIRSWYCTIMRKYGHYRQAANAKSKVNNLSVSIKQLGKFSSSFSTSSSSFFICRYLLLFFFSSGSFQIFSKPYIDYITQSNELAHGIKMSLHELLWGITLHYMSSIYRNEKEESSTSFVNLFNNYITKLEKKEQKSSWIGNFFFFDTYSQRNRQ